MVVGNENNVKLLLPGFRYYHSADKDFFFGRDEDISILRKKLVSGNFLTLLGETATGKSSLVNCGILHSLENLFGSKKIYPVVLESMRDPFESLADALRIFIQRQHRETAELENEGILKILRGSSSGFLNILDRIIQPGEKILFVFDHFEEVYCCEGNRPSAEAERERIHFLNALLDLITNNRPNIILLLVLDSNYISSLQEVSQLGELVIQNSYLLRKVTYEQLFRIIQAMNKIGDLELQESQIGELARKWKDKKHPLPLLQYAFRFLSGKSGELKRKNLTEHLSVEEELATLLSIELNAKYLSLNPKKRTVCEKIFKSLFVRNNKDGYCLAELTINELAGIADVPAGVVMDVIGAFAEIRPQIFSFSEEKEWSDTTRVSLSHVLVFSLWDRYGEWLKEEVESIQSYLKLSRVSELYQQGRGGLLTGLDLAWMQEWRNRNKPVFAWARRFNPAFQRAMIYLDLSARAAEKGKVQKSKKGKISFPRIKTPYLITGSIVVVIALLIMVLSGGNPSDEPEPVRTENRPQSPSRSGSVTGTEPALSRDNIIPEESQPEDSNFRTMSSPPVQVDRQDRTIPPPVTGETYRMQDISVVETRKVEPEEVVESGVSDGVIREKNAPEDFEKTSEDLIRASLRTENKELRSLLVYQAYLFREKTGGVDWDPRMYSAMMDALELLDVPVERIFGLHQKPVNDLFLRMGTPLLYSAGSDGKVYEWNVNVPGTSPRLLMNRSSIYELVAVSGDGMWLAAATFQGRIHVLNLKSGSRNVIELSGHEGSIKSLMFNPDNNRIISTGTDRKLRIWNILTGNYTELSNPYGIILDVGFSGDSRYLAGCTRDGRVLRWDTEGDSDSEPVVLFEDRVNSFYSLEFGKNGNILCVGDLNGMVHILDFSSGRRIAQVKNHNARVLDIAFNTAGDRVASASMDGSITVMRTGYWNDEKIMIRGERGFVLSLAFFPNSDQLLWCNSGTSEIIASPINLEELADRFCHALSRNLTREEWTRFIGTTIEYQLTCPSLGDNMQTH